MEGIAPPIEPLLRVVSEFLLYFALSSDEVYVMQHQESVFQDHAIEDLEANDYSWWLLSSIMASLEVPAARKSDRNELLCFLFPLLSFIRVWPTR